MSEHRIYMVFVRMTIATSLDEAREDAARYPAGTCVSCPVTEVSENGDWSYYPDSRRHEFDWDPDDPPDRSE